MDKKVLKMAAELMRNLSLTEIKLKDGDTEIEMRREIVSPVSPGKAESLPEEHETGSQAEDDDKYIDVLSPLLGIFYSSAASGNTPFVQVGSKVRAGDVLCRVEAMKMLNEIAAECDGTVADIYAEDGQLVEYGQPLFRIIAD